MSSYFGKNIHVSIFGQSHSDAIGVTVDDLPAGESVDLEKLQQFLDRRAPGRDATATPRKEGDILEVLCGLWEGKTCGAPLTAIIRNTNTRSQDYDKLRDLPRPAHADYTAQVKYGGHQDARGGGHFSGRLTGPLCIAGGVAKQILERRGIQVMAHVDSIRGIKDTRFDPLCHHNLPQLSANFPVLDSEVGEKMRAEILEIHSRGDSVGGSIECIATGLPAGLGSPMMEGMESRLSQLLFSIPAVKGVEFGAGFDVANMLGSENNDPFIVENDKIITESNHSGGILGGISNGMPLILRAAFKPTPSISMEQRTVSLSENAPASLVIHGRHDPCILPRAVPVVEAAVALVLLDLLLNETK